MGYGRSVGALLLCGASLAAFGQTADGPTLSDTEISTLMKDGGVIKGQNSRGQTYELRLSANGAMQATSTRTNGPGQITDGGKWVVKEASLCVTYTEWQGGATRCSSVKRNGEGFSYGGDGAALTPTKP